MFDWVAAFCSKVASTRRLPRVRAFILDVNRSSSSFGASTLPDFLPSLPWLRIYRPVAEFEEQIELIAETCCGAPDIDSMLRPLLGPRSLAIPQLLADLGVGRRVLPEPERLSDQTLNSIADVVARLRRHWTNELTKPETRHSVSNLVAPFALAAGLRQLHWPGSGKLANALEANDPHRRALKTLLDSLGLFNTSSRHDGDDGVYSRRQDPPLADDPHYFPTGIDDPFARFEKVNLLLVDDQYRLGYEAVLRCLLFGDSTTSTNGRVTLTADDSPDRLLSALYATVPELREPDTSQEAGAEQAFLRRLLHFFDYTGACQQLGESARALTRAARAARKLIDPTYTANASGGNSDTGRRCPQCGIDREHHSAQFDWSLPHLFGFSGPVGDTTGVPDVVFLDLRLFNEAASGYERPDFDHHLLLPLLISHVDPSLPIILFSSTQQRVVAEAFASRSNVITVFSKPLVSGYDEHRSGVDYIHEFMRAFRTALRLHEDRRIWIDLVAAATAVGKCFSEPRLTLDDDSSPNFVFDRQSYTQFTREYLRCFQQGWYSDALAVPGNILESNGLRKAMRSDLNALACLGAQQVLDAAKRPRESYAKAAIRLLDEPNHRRSVLAMVNLALRIEQNAQEQSRQQKIEANAAPDTVRNVASRLRALRTFFSVTFGNNRGLSAAHWVDAFMHEQPKEAEFLKGVYGSLNAVLGQAMNSHVLQQEQNGLLSQVEKQAAYQWYAPIGGLRNIRAHYALTPGKDDASVRHFAIWVWSWTLRGIMLYCQRCLPMCANAPAKPATLIEAEDRDWLPKASGPDSLDGVLTCRFLIERFVQMNELEIFRLEPVFAECAEWSRRLVTAR